jgi:sugar phosphate isomerase/epimerase
VTVPACSLNTITVRSLTLHEVIEQAQRRGIAFIAPWRDLLEPLGAAEAGRMISEAGLGVSSLLRGGLFTAEDRAGRQAAIEHNLRAIDAAAALDAGCLVLVCGGIVGRDISGSRSMVRDGIEAVLPHAHEAGVRLAVEPLHPMMIADRSVITSLGEANSLAESIGDAGVGVVVDSYNVWWDVALDDEIRRAGRRILCVQLSDWVTPIEGELSSRGMIGDGCIDLAAILEATAEAGYVGPVEVEILSDEWWARPPDLVIETVLERFESCVR